MVIIRNIDNPFKLEEAQVKKISYSRHKTLQEILIESGFDYENKRIIVSGKRIENLSTYLDNDDEVTIIPEVKAPVVAIVSAIVSAVWAVAVAHPFLFTFFVLSMGYAIYQNMNQPKMPDFNLGSAGMDEGSPTYGWDGIQTIQEVGVPVAVVYGEHRIGGNIINQFLWEDGDRHYLNVLLALCEGEIESIDSIEINNNPIANFAGVTVSKRFGTNYQSLISNFEDLHNLYPVNANLVKDSPYVYTTVDLDVEGFEIHLRLNNGLYQQNSDSGDIQSWSVTYKVEYKLHSEGTYIDLGETTISEKSRSTVRRVFRKVGLTPGQYDIRITRTSDDSSLSPLRQGDLTLFQIDELKTDDLSYPNTALLGLQLLATDQLNGGTPNITTIVKGKKVLVPDILNSGVPVDWEDYYWDGSSYRLLSNDTLLEWDGLTYVEKYSANPVWCLRDFIVTNRYGLGEFILTSHLDNASLLEMSQYCEEKVADGEGGFEKRFRLDVVIDSNNKALDILIQLSAVFNAMPLYSAGGITFKIDKQVLPTQLFGMGNIIKDSFVQSWKTIKEVPNVVEVQFADKEKNYRQETVAYVDEEALANGEPMRKSQARLFTTKTSYAIRAARYALKVAKYINRSIVFKAGIDAVACQAGDIISISHDVPQWGFSGRVKDGSTQILIKLDRPMTIEDGKSYKIQIRFSDDSIEEKSIISPAGIYTEIACEAFTNAPQDFDVYAIGETNKVKKDFRVVAIQREGKNEAQIQALEYNEAVYDDSDIILPQNNYSSLSGEIPLVTNLNLTESLVKKTDGTIENAIDVWFDLPSYVDRYVKLFAKAKIYLSDNNGASWVLRGETSDTHWHIQGGLSDGNTYKVAVVSADDLGKENPISDSPQAEITLQGKSVPPNDVTGFGVAFATDHLEFNWNENTDVDLWGYEIRELPYSGASWGLGTIVATKIDGRSYSHFNFSAGVKYYAIKAIDTSGNYSTNHATTSIIISSIPSVNVISIFEDVFFSGSLSGDAEICWIKGYSQDYYRPAISFRSDILWDTGNWDDGGYWDNDFDTASTGVYITPVHDLGASKEVGITLELGLANVQGGNLQIEIAYSDTDPAPMNWTNFASGNFTGRYFRFRLTLSTNNASYGIDLYRFKAIFDVPDKTEMGNNVSVSSPGWTTINLTGFTQVAVLIVSCRGGAYVVETDEVLLPASFKVKLKDPANSMAQVAGAINYYAQGY